MKLFQISYAAPFLLLDEAPAPAAQQVHAPQQSLEQNLQGEK